MKILISALCLFAAFPALAAPFDIFRDCDECPEMIELPLGEFMMGAPREEADRVYHLYDEGWRPETPFNPYVAYMEGPVHPVEIDIPFAMGRNEVTFDEWMACVDDGGCNGYIPDPTILWLDDAKIIQEIQATGQYPVMRISYLDALTYVDWINEKLGTDVYRLPTEAEWEYAARASTAAPFGQGERVTQDQINYTAPVGNDEHRDGDLIGTVLVPVTALKASNLWGLRHMSGNVEELTMSCWAPRHELWALSSTYIQNGVQQQTCTERVGRGGSHYARKVMVRSAARAPLRLDLRLPDIGFRVLREMPTPNM
jgi:formylglycine-generating enzyme required for sulfatase activity